MARKNQQGSLETNEKNSTKEKTGEKWPLSVSFHWDNTSTERVRSVQTHVTQRVSSTLSSLEKEWQDAVGRKFDAINLPSISLPQLEAGPGPSSQKSSQMAPLRTGKSQPPRRNSVDSSSSRRRRRQQSGSPKTPDSNASSLLSPQSVVPAMRRAMSDTSIENFLNSAKERVATATSEWNNNNNPSSSGNAGLGSKQNSLENLLSLSSPLSSQSVESLRKTGTLVHSRSAQALASAAQTLNTSLNNIQNNVNLLQVSLQQSFSDGKIAMETRYKQLAALGEPGSLFSSKERLADIIQVDDVVAQQSADGEKKGPLGPFQRNALRRKGAGAGAGSASSLSDYDKDHDKDTDTDGKKKSTLKEDGRNITIVTTAALPWMTGTAVNPLLRAAYLAKDGTKSVNLMVPWLAKSDQQRIFPNGVTFDSPDEQEAWVKQWLKKRTGFTPDFKLTFYPGRYAPEKCSILPVGDPTRYVPDSAADVAILEEPEHLTWYHHGRRWTDKFSHVVGVVHTNYLDYARREDGGSSKELLLRHVNNWVTRIHCHKVVKLSDAVQDLPRQTTEFVHGVADSFLSVGEKKSKVRKDGAPRFSKGAYFLGKCVWAKGYTELIELLSENKDKLGGDVSVDCYGTG